MTEQESGTEVVIDFGRQVMAFRIVVPRHVIDDRDVMANGALQQTDLRLSEVCHAIVSFDLALGAIEDQVVAHFTSREITADGANLDNLGIRGPASTWTILVDDHMSTDRLAAALLVRGNVGFAAGAALTGPLLLLWALSRRFKRGSRH